MQSLSFSQASSLAPDLYSGNPALSKQEERLELCQEAAHVLRSSPNFMSHAERVANCGRRFLCRFIGCPHCAGGRYRRNLLPLLNDLDSVVIQPGQELALATFTVPSIRPHALEATVQQLNTGLRRMIGRLPFSRVLTGALTSIEVTASDPSGLFHPHAHMLAVVEGGRMPDAALVTGKFERCSKLHSVHTDLQSVAFEEGILKKMSRYLLKLPKVDTFRNLLREPKRYLAYVAALLGKHLFRRFGLFRPELIPGWLGH